jgi:hypothetical protein
MNDISRSGEVGRHVEYAYPLANSQLPPRFFDAASHCATTLPGFAERLRLLRPDSTTLVPVC